MRLVTLSAEMAPWNFLRFLRMGVTRVAYNAAIDASPHFPNPTDTLTVPPRYPSGLKVGTAYRVNGDLMIGGEYRRGQILVFKHEACDPYEGCDVYCFQVPGFQRWIYIKGLGVFANPQGWVHMFEDATNLTSKDFGSS